MLLAAGASHGGVLCCFGIEALASSLSKAVAHLVPDPAAFHSSLCLRPAHVCICECADAARAALGVLVRSAHLLPPVLAEQLVLHMGQCRMTESARNLAGVVAASKAPGSLSDPAIR